MMIIKHYIHVMAQHNYRVEPWLSNVQVISPPLGHLKKNESERNQNNSLFEKLDSFASEFKIQQ